MTETPETVTNKKPEPTADHAAAEEPVRRAPEQGPCLTGPDGPRLLGDAEAGTA